MNNIIIKTSNKEEQIVAANFISALTGYSICNTMIEGEYKRFPYVGVYSKLAAGFSYNVFVVKEYSFQDIPILLKDQNIGLTDKHDWRETRIKVSNLAEQQLVAYILSNVLSVPIAGVLNTWNSRFPYIYCPQNIISANVTAGKRNISFKEFLQNLIIKEEEKEMKTNKFQVYVGDSLIIKQTVEDLLYKYGYSWNTTEKTQKLENLSRTQPFWRIGSWLPNKITYSDRDQGGTLINATTNMNGLIEFLEKQKQPQLPEIAGYEGEYNEENDELKYGCIRLNGSDVVKLHNQIKNFNKNTFVSIEEITLLPRGVPLSKNIKVDVNTIEKLYKAIN